MNIEYTKTMVLKKIRASMGFEPVTSTILVPPNPVEALIFFQASLFQLLKLEIHCEDHILPSYISAVHI